MFDPIIFGLVLTAAALFANLMKEPLGKIFNRVCKLWFDKEWQQETCEFCWVGLVYIISLTIAFVMALGGWNG